MQSATPIKKKQKNRIKIKPIILKLILVISGLAISVIMHILFLLIPECKILGAILVGVITLVFAFLICRKSKTDNETDWQKENQKEDLNATRLWETLCVVYLFAIFVVFQMLLHSFYCGSLWMCLRKSSFVFSAKLSKAIPEVAKVIGIGSIFIMTLLGALNKKELNICYDALLITKFPRYEWFIIGHFAMTVLALILSYLKIIGAASVCLFAIIYDSFVIGYLFNFLILSPDKRRKEAIKKWRSRIDEDHTKIETVLMNLIGEVVPSNGPEYDDIYECISYGLIQMVRQNKQQETNQSFAPILNSISSVWLCLFKDKTPDERRQISEHMKKSFKKAFSKNEVTQNELVVIYLCYLYALKKNIMGESETNAERFHLIHSELCNNMPFASDPFELLLQKTPQYGIALLFWVSFFGNDLVGSKKIYKDLSTIHDDNFFLNAHKDIFKAFAICAYEDGSIGHNLPHCRVLHIVDIALEMVFKERRQ